MRLVWSRLDPWLRWEAEWEMARRRLPRPVAVAFDGDAAALVAYGPSPAAAPTPRVVADLGQTLGAVAPERFAVAWPVDDGGLHPAPGSRRILRLALAVTTVETVDGKWAWTQHRLACQWRGRQVRWGSEREVDTGVEQHSGRFRAAFETTSRGRQRDGGDHLMAAARDVLADDLEVYVHPAGAFRGLVEDVDGEAAPWVAVPPSGMGVATTGGGDSRNPTLRAAG